MQNIHIPIQTSKKKGAAKISASLKRWFLEEKLQNPFGFVFLGLFAVIIAFAIAKLEIAGGVLVIGGVIAIPFLYAVVVYPEIGIWVLLVMAYMLFSIIRLGLNFPVGTLMDVLQLILILGFLIHQRNKPAWEDLKGPVTIMILIWIVFNIIEIANPAAESRLSWVYTIRSVALVMLTYFVFISGIRRVSFIRVILKTWIFLALIAAIYGLKQEIGRAHV